MTTTVPPTISFDDYSKKYDLLLKHSPPYQEIGEMIVQQLKKQYASDTTFSVLDIGGGTGNFSKYIHDAFPKAQITLLEPNEKMRAIAQHKLATTKGIFEKSTFESYTSKQTHDVLLCVHALYLMPNSKSLIPKFGEFMHADSTLIICDIGQEIEVIDWMFYLLKVTFKKYGFWKTVELFRLSTEIKSANQAIQTKQQTGDLWKHDLATFKAWFEEQYKVLTAQSCYRECSNFLVCKPL